MRGDAGVAQTQVIPHSLGWLWAPILLKARNGWKAAASCSFRATFQRLEIWEELKKKKDRMSNDSFFLLLVFWRILLCVCMSCCT